MSVVVCCIYTHDCSTVRGRYIILFLNTQGGRVCVCVCDVYITQSVSVWR